MGRREMRWYPKSDKENSSDDVSILRTNENKGQFSMRMGGTKITVDTADELMTLITEWNDSRRKTLNEMKTGDNSPHPLWERVNYTSGEKRVVRSRLKTRTVIAVLTEDGDIITGYHYKYSDGRDDRIEFDEPIMGDSGRYYDYFYMDWKDNKYFDEIRFKFTVLGEA